MKFLIVNADDFGLSPGVNSGIREAQRQGIVTSASLISNLPGAKGAASLSRKNPSLCVGLHLNLSAGQPLTGCPSLTWADGSFLPLLRVLLRVAMSPRARREAWAEMDAQVEEARRLRVRLDHLNSHHHVHLFGPLLERAAAIAKELRVPMRLPAERLAARDWLQGPGAGLPSYLAARARRKPAMPAGAGHTLGLRLHRTGFDGEMLVRLLTAVPDGVTELICHPGHADEQLSRYSHYTLRRESELAALTHPPLKSALQEAKIERITWKQVAHRRGVEGGESVTGEGG
ncbi:MAG TPA: ChbG/HpnK family deacetylase, partial [Dehalococcoidia bacterium]|nr:ChbG/HpnK family deacetylase [Dehalococcoidia bacterium]